VRSNRGGIPEAIGDFGKTIELDKNFVENTSNEIIDKSKNGYKINKILNKTKNFTWREIVNKELEIIGGKI